MPKEKITLEKLAGMLQKEFRGIDERFDLVDEELHLINGRLDAIEMELMSIKKKLDEVIYRIEFEHLKDRVALLEKEFATLKKK